MEEVSSNSNHQGEHETHHHEESAPHDRDDQGPQWEDYVRVLTERQQVIAKHGYGTPIGLGTSEADTTESEISETNATTTTTAHGVAPRGQTLDVNTQQPSTSNDSTTKQVDQLIEYIENNPEFYVSVPGPAARSDNSQHTTEHSQAAAQTATSSTGSFRSTPSHDVIETSKTLGDVLQHIIKRQEERTSLFKELERSFKKYVTEAEESSVNNQKLYQRDVELITKQMADISSKIRELIPRLQELEAESLAKKVEELQQHEKNNLQSVIDMQVVRSELLVAQRLQDFSKELNDSRVAALQSQLDEKERFRQGVLDAINEVMEDVRVEAAEQMM